jgi:hypothetical protein
MFIKNWHTVVKCKNAVKFLTMWKTLCEKQTWKKCDELARRDFHLLSMFSPLTIILGLLPQCRLWGTVYVARYFDLTVQQSLSLAHPCLWHSLQVRLLVLEIIWWSSHDSSGPWPLRLGPGGQQQQHHTFKWIILNDGSSSMIHKWFIIILCHPFLHASGSDCMTAYRLQVSERVHMYQIDRIADR